jgi:NTP pyrophosphatase (non-canonical NTP hydrolase)
MTNPLTLDEYQRQAETTFIVEENKIEYVALGLSSEVGEICDKLKKHLRDQGEPLADMDYDKRLEVMKEAGDVLWYLAVLAAQFQFDLSSVAEMNLRKLDRRMQLDLIKGSGDNR